MSTRKKIAAVMLLAMIIFLCQSTTTFAATPITAKYHTPKKRGTITFASLRATRGIVEGTFLVNGKSHPGSMYAATGGRMGMVWYYGYSGNSAGDALLAKQPDGSQSGTIRFFDQKGRLIDTGTIRLVP